VDVVRCVALDWRQWIAAPPAKDTLREPEELILGAPHDPDLARVVGPLFETVLAQWGDVEFVKVPGQHLSRLILTRESNETPHLFRAKNARTIVASERARDLLQSISPKSLMFQDVEIRD
jgi:hypothetical protein